MKQKVLRGVLRRNDDLGGRRKQRRSWAVVKLREIQCSDLAMGTGGESAKESCWIRHGSNPNSTCQANGKLQRVRRFDLVVTLVLWLIWSWSEIKVEWRFLQWNTKVWQNVTTNPGDRSSGSLKQLSRVDFPRLSSRIWSGKASLDTKTSMPIAHSLTQHHQYVFTTVQVAWRICNMLKVGIMNHAYLYGSIISRFWHLINA